MPPPWLAQSDARTVAPLRGMVSWFPIPGASGANFISPPGLASCPFHRSVGGIDHRSKARSKAAGKVGVSPYHALRFGFQSRQPVKQQSEKEADCQSHSITPILFGDFMIPCH